MTELELNDVVDKTFFSEGLLFFFLLIEKVLNMPILLINDERQNYDVVSIDFMIHDMI